MFVDLGICSAYEKEEAGKVVFMCMLKVNKSNDAK